MIKNILLALGITMVVFGAYFFPMVKETVELGSAPGTQFGTAKVAQVNINPQSITSTSTSLYNSDGSDRFVTDAFVSCSGLTSMAGATAGGVATFNWTAATTSSPAPTATVATRALAAMQVTLATSTAYNLTATSTYATPWPRIWRAGEYMTFQTNATSSATACTVGVSYIQS